MLFWLSNTKRLEIHCSMLYLQNLLSFPYGGGGGGGCNHFFFVVVVFDFQFITSLYFSIFLWSRYLIVALLKSFLLMC